MTKTRRWLALPLLAAVAYLGFRSLGDPVEPGRDEPPTMIYNRVWLEKLPDSATDYVHGSYVLSVPEVGMFQRASGWDFHIELFQYDADGGKLKLTFPQTSKNAKITFTIKGCDDMPPFDLCLTLNENPWGGPKKYHGFRDSEDEAKRLPGMREEFRARAAAGSH